jgi:hypothetical protein
MRPEHRQKLIDELKKTRANLDKVATIIYENYYETCPDLALEHINKILAIIDKCNLLIGQLESMVPSKINWEKLERDIAS